MFEKNSGLGIHGDVLAAEPKDEESVLKLTTELKSRAAQSIKVGNFPEAVTLYSKAIEVNTIESVVAILFANRSMCQLKMGLNVQALEDATAAISKDSSYTKAYYRKGMSLLALQKLSEAKIAFEQGLAIKPDDKELAEQLSKLSSVASASSSTKPPSSGVATSAKPSKAKTTSSTKPSEEEEKDEEEETGPPIRGYKTTEDGRKTTFFNHDLSAEAKALIGDIAPKKLEMASVQQPSPPMSGTGSAWNTAGTFESVNMTAWCTQRLTELIQGVSVVTPDGGSIKVDSVTLVGEGEIVSNRGKVKRICDFTLSAKWVLSADNRTLKGTMEVADISADEDFEVSDVKIDGTSVPELQSLFVEHVKKSTGTFQKAVVGGLHQFCQEFKSKNLA